MDTERRDEAVEAEEELKKLRAKTDKDELAELKRRMLGGYRKQDVEQFVDRLKEQLQTAERTFKGHIAVLAEEKEKLRCERDELLAQMALRESEISVEPEVDPKELKRMEANADCLKAELLEARHAAEAIAAERAELDEKLHALSALADENAAELEGRIAKLEEEKEAQQREEEAREAELRGEITGLETLAAAKDAEIAGLAGKLADAEERLARVSGEARQAREQHAEARQENCRLIERTSALGRENEALASQVEAARQNILRVMADKEEAEALNGRMREALNTLVVKADAVIKENAVLASQIDAERDRTQQYQAMHEKLSDTLARIRMAGAMLDERLLEADKTLAWGAVQAARPTTGRRGRKDVLDFTDGKSDALHDIICELNNIQQNLSQYQPATAQTEPDKKPNIRYSVEKLEVDCDAAKRGEAKDSLDKLMLPVNGEYIKNR